MFHTDLISLLNSYYIDFKSLNRIASYRHEWTNIVHVSYRQPCIVMHIASLLKSIVTPQFSSMIKQSMKLPKKKHKKLEHGHWLPESKIKISLILPCFRSLHSSPHVHIWHFRSRPRHTVNLAFSPWRKNPHATEKPSPYIHRKQTFLLSTQGWKNWEKGKGKRGRGKELEVNPFLCSQINTSEWSPAFPDCTVWCGELGNRAVTSLS